MFVVGLKRYETSIHDSPVRTDLAWLSVPQCIEYRVTVLTYKVLHGSAPRYLGPLVPVVDLADGHDALLALAVLLART